MVTYALVRYARCTHDSQAVRRHEGYGGAHSSADVISAAFAWKIIPQNWYANYGSAGAFCITTVHNYRIIESWNGFGWKRRLRSLTATINTALSSHH